MAHTALVLGGGGITGIAWEIGVLTGLADRGHDLSAADTLIGTSAGSVVGAQVADGRSMHELYDDQFGPVDPEIGGKFGLSATLRMALPVLLPGREVTMRRRIGRVALKAHPESADTRLRVIGARIGVQEWPARDLRITAVDADSGESAVFGPRSGVPLVHAVAASCAVPLVWPPVPINGRRYMDGGMRSSVNADLVSGADIVAVLAPLPRSFSRRHRIPAQLRRLGGVHRSVVITPDKQALADIGRDLLDPAKRAQAARTGRRQAGDLADQVEAAWSA